MSTIRRAATLTAMALIAAASLTAATGALGSAASASQLRPAGSFGATETGYGSTPAAAQGAANRQMRFDYTGCNTPTLVWDVSVGAGEWEAEVAAVCTGYN